MTDRRGFSLVEMVIVMVLAGIVSTAAISMFSTQNRLNAALTALGESQENARSAVQVASSELRGASAGMVQQARADRLILRMPIVIGFICGQQNPQMKAIYLPMNGRELDLQDDVDGYAFRSDLGNWATGYKVAGSDRFGQNARRRCEDEGNGTAGDDGDYAILRVGGSIGNAVMLYREITYYFAPSSLDSSRRAFFRQRGTEAVELAQGFSSDTGFEYLLASTGTWVPNVNSGDFRHIRAIRLSAEVVAEGTSGSATGSATFSLEREIQLRNSE